jgi:hypothetical protein
MVLERPIRTCANLCLLAVSVTQAQFQQDQLTVGSISRGCAAGEHVGPFYTQTKGYSVQTS